MIFWKIVDSTPIQNFFRPLYRLVVLSGREVGGEGLTFILLDANVIIEVTNIFTEQMSSSMHGMKKINI